MLDGQGARGVPGVDAGAEERGGAGGGQGAAAREPHEQGPHQPERVRGAVQKRRRRRSRGQVGAAEAGRRRVVRRPRRGRPRAVVSGRLTD